MKPWTDDVLTPPGIVGDVVEWMRGASGMYQPKFALAAGLTVCAALVGRAVKDRTGQRTNIYTLAIGNTSAGKNAPISLIRRLVTAIGQEKLIVGEACSASAIEVLLNVFPVRLFLLDEIGFYLSTLRTAGRSDVNLRTVVPALMKCWSCAGDIFCGKVRAKDSNGKWEPPKNILEPCVCLYGTATPDTVFEGMTSAEFADGSIPRFLPFISLDRPKFVARDDAVVPVELVESIKDRLARWGVKQHGAKNQERKPDDIPTAGLMRTDPVAEVVFRDLSDFVHERLLAADKGDKIQFLWGKAVELARRVALTVAVFCPDESSVSMGVADYAVNLVKLAIGDLIEYAERHVADSRVERVKKRILEVVRAAGAAGAERGLITRRTQDVGRRERDEALADLTDADEVVEVERPGRGKKFITTYYSADGAKKARERERAQFVCSEADL